MFRLVQFVQGQHIDLIDCHSASAASTALAARLLGTPVVQTFHYDFKKDVVHKYLCRCGTDHIVTVSNWIADDLTRLGFAPRTAISTIPTGIDLNRFRPEIHNHIVRQELHIPDKALVISIIAMIRPDKGHKYVIRAVDRVVNANPETCFLIVGSATRREYLHDIHKELVAICHRDKVILTGFRQDVERMIAASDVIVNASLFEPRSQVIHQAFAMKKLVVASNAGGNPESIIHGQTGFLFHSQDVESLSQTILAVLGHNTEQIRARAYQEALSKFGEDAMMDQTLQIYHRLLTGKRFLRESRCRGEN
jgi:glycosyltransferase involved in cell wall biosynthesis